MGYTVVMKPSRKKKIAAALAAVLFILYWVFVNLLLSAVLVPSFMERLDSFRRITEQSYAQQVYTSDLTSNSSVIWTMTNSWVRNAAMEKCEIVSGDGYLLKAALFPAGEDAGADESGLSGSADAD